MVESITAGTATSLGPNANDGFSEKSTPFCRISSSQNGTGSPLTGSSTEAPAATFASSDTSSNDTNWNSTSSISTASASSEPPAGGWVNERLPHGMP